MYANDTCVLRHEAHHEQAVLDVPCILFVEELLAAYPDSKVILTERPVEGELTSVLLHNN